MSLQRKSRIATRTASLTIPELNLNTLSFPELKRRSNEGGGSKAVIGNNGRSVPTDKPRFDFSLIEDGVDEGQRHSALVSYIGHLIWRGLSKQEIKILVTDWNQSNRPPLSKSELEGTVDYCYARYATGESPDNFFVPTKTLSLTDSVIVETKPYPRISRRHPLYTPESPNPTPAPELTNPWQLEDARTYTQQDCGKRRSIIRKGREYLSVSFFCGCWSCPRCGPYFRQRWIDHILEKTKDTALYVTEISEDDWGRVRRAISRLDADYVKIKTGGVYKIITDKPVTGSTALKQNEVKGYLESSIPLAADKNPISTSRGWEHHKSDKTKGEYEAVYNTWLPLKEQLEVAEALGARKTKYNRWISPQDADEVEWSEEFKEGIWKRERLVNWWLYKSDYRVDMRDYLNQQYAEDRVNDEYGAEDPFDQYLLEAA